MIDVQGLSKHYGSFVATRDISFQVGKGEVVGFLGPNGAGKSTTMRMLTCFLSPTSGTALVEGFDIIDKPHEVKKRIGYLPESTPLYLDLSTREYLSFVSRVRKIPRARRKSVLSEVIQTCGLEKVLKRPLGKLSKGFRQRVGIAQALIHRPDFLVLDEPTSGLDPNQIVEIRELIRRIGEEKTVILSTHILPEVSATCNRVIIIHEGRIAADGTPEELGQKVSGGESYFLRLAEEAAEAAEALEQIPEVVEVELSSGRSRGENGLRIRCSSGEDIGEKIFRLAVAKNWRLAELRRETPTLEEVFVRLTLGGSN